MQFLKKESAYQERSLFLQISDSDNRRDDAHKLSKKIKSFGKWMNLRHKLNCLGFMNQGHINLVKYKNRIISNE